MEKEMSLQEILDEIVRLQNSEDVKRFEKSERQRLMQRLYNLRWKEKQGKKLAKNG